MKEIVLFLCAIVTCHFAEGYWRNRGNWQAHDRQYDTDTDGEFAGRPPWWRNKNSGPNNEEGDNSNEDPSSPPFRRWPIRHHEHGYYDHSDEDPPIYPPRTSAQGSEDLGRAIDSNPPVNVDTIAACTRSCSVTQEYNPVCGSNGVTYANPGRLECAQRCGVDVQLIRNTACGVAEPDVARTNLDACVSDCPTAPDFNPVCGTNDVTYANPARLQCNQRCGVSVVVDKYAPCFRFPNLNDSVVKIEVDACFKYCPISSIDKPVCGNNGITYKNPDALQCARKCGINVNIKSRDKCPKRPDEKDGNKVTEKPEFTVTTAKPDCNCNPVNVTPKPNYEVTETSRDKLTTPSLSDVMACMQLCPLTSEYLPICGTDGITYTNPGRLLCSQFCGIDVNVKKWSPCESTLNTNFNCPYYPVNGGNQNPQPTNVEACLKACPVKDEYEPVCGTDNLTYINIDGLLCAKRCGVDVCLKKQSACEGNVNPLTPPTPPFTNITPPTPSINGDKDKVTNGGIDFTIPPDVLHSIFPSNNPDINATTTEDYKIDERFNEDPPETEQKP